MKRILTVAVTFLAVLATVYLAFVAGAFLRSPSAQELTACRKLLEDLDDCHGISLTIPYPSHIDSANAEFDELVAMISDAARRCKKTKVTKPVTTAEMDLECGTPEHRLHVRFRPYCIEIGDLCLAVSAAEFDELNAAVRAAAE